MSNFNDAALESLLSTFRSEQFDTEFGTGRASTGLQRALNNETASRDLAISIRETIASQRQIDVLREKQRLEQEAAALEAAQKRQNQVNAILAQADQDLKSHVSAEEYADLEGTAYAKLWREKVIGQMLQDRPITDFTDESQIEAINALQSAQGLAIADRQRNLDDEQALQFGEAVQLDEAFSNRDRGLVGGVFGFVRNAAGDLVRGLGGAADLAVTLGTLGVADNVGAAIRELGNAVGEGIDSTSTGTSIQRARRAEQQAAAEAAGTPEGFLEGLGNSVGTLNAGAVADAGATIASLLTGAPAVSRVAAAAAPRLAALTGRGGNLGARAASGTDRATDILTRAGDSIGRGGGSALTLSAGLNNADSAVSSEGGGLADTGLLGPRFRQAATLAGGTAALAGLGGLRRAIPGTNTSIGSLVSGVEGAAAQQGILRGLVGPALAPASAVRTAPTLTGRVAQDVLNRVGSTARTASGRAVSEGNQELLETVAGQAANTVGTGQNQFNSSELGGAFGLGSVLGGGLGAGRALTFRPGETAPAAATDTGTTTDDTINNNARVTGDQAGVVSTVDTESLTGGAPAVAAPLPTTPFQGPLPQQPFQDSRIGQAQSNIAQSVQPDGQVPFQAVTPVTAGNLGQQPVQASIAQEQAQQVQSTPAQVVPDSAFLTPETNAQLNGNAVEPTPNLPAVIANPISESAKRRNRRAQAANASTNPGVVNARQTDAIGNPVLTGQQVNSLGRDAFNQAVPNGVFGEGVGSSRVRNTTPSNDASSAPVENIPTRPIEEVRAQVNTIIAEAETPPTREQLIEATLSDTTDTNDLITVLDEAGFPAPSQSPGEPVANNVTNPAPAPITRGATTPEPAAPNPNVNEVLGKALDSDNTAAILKSSLVELSKADTQLTPDQIVAEFERRNPESSQRPIRKPRPNESEESIDEIPTRGESLLDNLIERAKVTPEATTDATDAVAYTEAQMDEALQAGDVKTALRAARQLFESGAITQEDLASSGYAAGVEPGISERFLDVTSRYQPVSRVDNRTPLETINDTIADAETSLLASQESGDFEQAAITEQRLNNLRNDRRELINNEPEAAPVAAPSTESEVDVAPTVAPPQNLPPSQQAVFDTVNRVAEDFGGQRLATREQIQENTEGLRGTITKAINSLVQKGVLEEDGNFVRVVTPVTEGTPSGEPQAAASRSPNETEGAELPQAVADARPDPVAQDTLTGEPAPANTRERTNTPPKDTNPESPSGRTVLRRSANRNLKGNNTNYEDEGASTEPAQPLSKSDIRAYTNSKVPGWDIKIISDANELSPELQARVREHTGFDWDDNADAMIDGTTLYINQNTHFKTAELDLTLAHEILGHLGLRAQHGPDLNTFLREMLDTAGGLEGLLNMADSMNLDTRADYDALIARAQQQGIGYNQDHFTVAEEVLTGIVENDGLSDTQVGIVERMGANIRAWMRRKFPRLAKFLGADTIANWELVMYARDASRAGRKLLDGGYTDGTPRIFMSRRTDRMQEKLANLTNTAEGAREYAKNVIEGNAPLDQKLSGTSANIKSGLKRVRRQGSLDIKENAYNKFFRNIINNRRPLQLTSVNMREDYAAASPAQRERMIGDLVTNVNKGNLNLSKDVTAEQTAIITNLFENMLGKNTSIDAKHEIAKDKVALYEVVQLSGAQAEWEHIVATQELDGDLRGAISTLAAAMDGALVTQREAYEFADSYVRILHGVEGNEAFFWDVMKNRSNWNKWVGKDVVAEVDKVRARTYATDNTAIEPEVAFAQEKAILKNAMRSLEPEELTAINEFRNTKITRTGKNGSTNDLNEQLAKMKVTDAELKALDLINDVLDRYRALAESKRESWSGANQDYLDQVQRYQWKHYAPQWTANKGKNNEFMMGSGVYDSMTSTFDAARGQRQTTTSPIASIIQMTNQQFHDSRDNDVTKNVMLLWAMAQTEDGARILGKQWGDGSLELVKKNTKKYRKLRRRNNPDSFILSIPDHSNEYTDAKTRGEKNAALENSPSNYVLVLNYKRKKGAAKRNAHIPDLVKGRKQRSDTIQALRESDNIAANILTENARVMGMMHTKYNPGFYMTNLLRETIAAFSTVGAKTGLEGAGQFATESMAASMRDMPKIAQFLYYSGLPGKEAAAQVAKAQADPQLKDFFEYWNSGAPTQFTRALTLNGRMDDFANNLRARGLTPDANLKFQEADRIIAMAPMLTDMVGRLAAYKTFRKQDYSIQQAASETRGILDFEQRGEHVAADLGSMGYMFFNSAMGGLGQIVDLALDSEFNLEAAAIAGAAATALFAAAYGMSGEDEDGNNLFLTQGESPTHFKFFLGDSTVIQIPYSYNPFTAIAAITHQGLFAATGNQSFTDAAVNMVDIVANNLTPVQNNIPLTDDEGNLSLTRAAQKFTTLGLPTLVNPMAMLAMNTNNFGAPISSEGGVGDPGRYGRVYNTPGSQIGNLSEDLARGLLTTTGYPMDVGKISFLLGEYLNGPQFAYNSAAEWTRIASGENYTPDAKRAAFIFAGVIGKPYSKLHQDYYQMRAQLDDFDRSRRSLVKAGLTASEAEEYMRATVGQKRMNDLDRFESINQRVVDIAKEMSAIRYTSILSDAQRLNRYNELKSQHSLEIGRVVRQLQGK